MVDQESRESSASSDSSSARQDLILASTFAALGLVGILLARGGIGGMIAGSVGTVGASMAGVLLIAGDGRLSYRAKVGVAIPFTLLMLITSLLTRDNPFAFVGYPLLTLGVVGLLPALRKSAQIAPADAPEEATRHAPRERKAREAEARSPA